MGHRKLILSIVGVSALAVATVLIVLPIAAQDVRLPLTPDQVQLVAEKEEARKLEGAPGGLEERGSAPPRASPPTVRHDIRVVHTSKAERLAKWEAAWEADQPYLAAIERDAGPAAAEKLRRAYLRQRERIEALPDGAIELQIPTVEIGFDSIAFSEFTYNASDDPVDPINEVFYEVGSAWDVQYDLRWWTSHRWKITDCGGTQWVWIWDGQHRDGWDGWREMQYQLEPEEQPSGCGAPRDHVRLFGSFVWDSMSTRSLASRPGNASISGVRYGLTAMAGSRWASWELLRTPCCLPEE